MNTKISPAADLAIRQQIERAVRPVRAGRDRKLAMREELYAHLTALFTEELQLQPDEQAALSAAVRRFGEPAALTVELDASVGFTQRYAYYEDLFSCLFSPSSGEPLFRFALRILCALGLTNLFVFVSAALVDGTVVRIGSDDPSKLRLLPHLILMLLVGEVAAVVAAWHISRTLNRDGQLSRWLWASGLAVLWSLIVIAIVALFWWSVTGTFAGFQSVAGRAAIWGSAGLAAVFAPLPALFLGGGLVLQASQKYRQKYDAWTNLAIDE